MNFIIPSLVASIFYMIYKIIDLKYISKEELLLKNVVKDGLVVFLCAIASSITLEQLNNYNLLDEPKNVLSAFTNAPDF
jgi:hypothetical protein